MAEAGAPLPDRPLVLVLVEPQDLVNVASAVRVAKNFGIGRIRVVSPAVPLDPYRIEGIAHHTGDLIARIEVLPSLAAAVADCVFTALLTARGRTAKRRMLRPREAASLLVSEADAGPVAIVAGREDSGLTNAELDLGHALVTIPTDPRHPSLNLAQAVALMAYETWLARGGEGVPLKPPRRAAAPATGAQLEALFADWERALWAVEFFKTRRAEAVMRSFREVVHRAGLDGREASLVRAMGIEVVRFLERRGVAAGAGPAAPSKPPGA